MSAYLCEMVEKEMEYKVPAEGSLSLLALGAVGVRAWRQERDKNDGNESED